MGGSTANYFGLSGDLAVKYRFLLFFLGSMEIDGLYMRVSQNSLSQSLDNCVIFLFWLKIYKLLMKRAPT